MDKLLVQVSLYNQDEQLVTRIKLLPYLSFENCVVLWGDRVFTYDDNKGRFIEGNLMIANPQDLR